MTLQTGLFGPCDMLGESQILSDGQQRMTDMRAGKDNSPGGHWICCN